MELSLVFPATFFHGLLTFSSLMLSYCLVSSEKSSSSSPFHSNFLFGTASSAYQFEGAFLSDGKGLNNWDVFTHTHGNIIDGTNGDVAVDHYHRYLEDIELMEFIGVNSYRFSLSWARILPKGRFGTVNMAGIDYYNKLIDALLEKGIEPFVTLNHYDIPQALEDRYGAWLSPQVQEDFRYYADICFESFGDRVKYWVTFNEPNVMVIRGYRDGSFPPYGSCKSRDPEREPFIAAHNIILSHAAAVNTYRTKYQGKQGGFIGIVMHTFWFEPISDSFEDKLAAERAQSFFSNWFLEPVTFGRYPAAMEEILGLVLPVFSKKDQKRLKDGADFIGINYYTSRFVKDCMFSACKAGRGTSKSEGYALTTSMKDGFLIGEPTDIDWLFVNPQGMTKMVTYIKERYNNIPIFITENGFGEKDKPSTATEDLLNDTRRVNFMSSHLRALETAIREGADVRGYFAWSLLDNFEWTAGYSERYGLYRVDYATLNRTPKSSTFWYKSFISQNEIRENATAIFKSRKEI